MAGRDWPGRDNTASEPIDDRAPRRHRELIAALDWLPVASLILAEDGTVLAANQAWGDLMGTPVTDSDQWRRGGWLRAVGPRDAETLWSALQEAAAGGGTGSADVRLTGASRAQWSRWWWRAGPTGYLIVCAGKTAKPGEEGAGRVVSGQASSAVRLAATGSRQQSGSADSLAGPPGPEAGDHGAATDALGMVVHRLFGIGLDLRSVTSRTDEFMGQRLQHTLDELDDLIRDVRSAAFGLGCSLYHH